MDAEVAEAAPYRSVRHALYRAFAGEERVICASPMLYGARAGRSDMSPYDHAAQDGAVVWLVYDYCRAPVVAATAAQYMPGSLTMARGQLLSKHGAIRLCVDHVMEYPHLSGYPRAYIADVARLWAGVAPSKAEPDWMDVLGKSSRMLRVIKNGCGGGAGRKPKPGINTVLDDLLDEAEAVMRPILRARRIIE